jgi:hypothetical protein
MGGRVRQGPVPGLCSSVEVRGLRGDVCNSPRSHTRPYRPRHARNPFPSVDNRCTSTAVALACVVNDESAHWHCTMPCPFCPACAGLGNAGATGHTLHPHSSHSSVHSSGSGGRQDGSGHGSTHGGSVHGTCSFPRSLLRSLSVGAGVPPASTR